MFHTPLRALLIMYSSVLSTDRSLMDCARNATAILSSPVPRAGISQKGSPCVAQLSLLRPGCKRLEGFDEAEHAKQQLMYA